MSKKHRKKIRCWAMFFADDRVINIRNDLVAKVISACREEVPPGHVPIEYINPMYGLEYDYVPADDLDKA